MKEIFHRTSVRKYQDRAIEQEKIELMLRAAMAAPSAGNQQPWEYYVVTAKDVIQKLSQTSPYAICAAAAPLVFVACYRRDCKLPDYAQIDLSASVENLLLAADSLGLGAVWMGIAPLPERMEAVRQVLDMPQELVAFALIPCGYPQSQGEQQDRYEPQRVHYLQ